MILRLSHKDSAKIESIEKLVDEFLLLDCSFCGEKIDIEVDCDFTEIEGGEFNSDTDRLFFAVHQVLTQTVQ